MATRLRVHFGTAPVPGRPLTDRHLFNLCVAGREPAELLDDRLREDLVHHLHCLGWTVVEIATHTRLSTYTAGRILTRLGLDHYPAPPADVPAGA